jgi:hypothetical protein
MNPDIVDLVQRPYADIVDDILTAIVGGVVREPILFDLKQVFYPLSRPASSIRRIVGTRTPPLPAPDLPVHTTFVQGADYTFDPVQNAVVWQKGGAKPDDETTFYVDYTVPNVNPPLTDINVGSVTRTLSEAIGREIATVFQQINQAYLAGYVDTATGQALDLVVSILGVVRKGADFATGLATLLRDPAITGNITIPLATEMATADGKALFVTTELRTMQQGQIRIDVPIRAGDAFRGPLGVSPAGSITKLTQPIAGIASVTNFDPTVLPSAPETDDQLRARARSALQALSKATLAGLQEVVAEEGSEIDEVWDPNLEGAHRSDPGRAIFLVKTEPQRYLSLQSAVDEARAAGVLTSVLARFVFFRPRVVARIATADMPPSDAGKLKLEGQIIDAMGAFVTGLSAGTALNGPKFLEAVAKSVPELNNDPTNLRVVDVTTWRGSVAPPGPDATVDALLTAIADTPAGNVPALRTALANVLTAAPSTAPASDRTPDPSLVQGLGGGSPSHAEIEAGQFQITATVDGNPWQIVLDVSPADIVLVER